MQTTLSRQAHPLGLCRDAVRHDTAAVAGGSAIVLTCTWATLLHSCGWVHMGVLYGWVKLLLLPSCLQQCLSHVMDNHPSIWTAVLS